MWNAGTRNQATPPRAPNLPPWARFLVPVTGRPRITPALFAHERLMLGEDMFRQESLCPFITPGSLLFSHSLIDSAIAPAIKPLFPGGRLPELSPSSP